MAINPNVDFVAGAILTASQQNRFGRGVMALTTGTANVPFGGETTIITTTFTAVANRNYKISWFEPDVRNNGTNGYSVTAMKNGATVLTTMNLQQAVANSGYILNSFYIGTFSAGNVTITCTMISTNVGLATRTSTARAFLCVEDLGQA